jgi:hypothetical protein
MPTAVFLVTGNNDRIAIGVVPGRPGAFLADLDFLSLATTFLVANGHKY